MLDGDGLLDLYQRGRGASQLSRAGLLGQAATGAAAGDMSLGDLDRSVWALRMDLAGGAGAEAVCDCPSCGARLEFPLPADFMLPAARTQGAELDWHGRRYRLRMPRLSDLGPEGLRRENLGDGPWHDPGFAAAAGAALQEADPALGMTLAMDCPDCGAALIQGFDPVGFLWAEIEEMARRLIGDVTRLARLFGWSEASILVMPPARRALYLAEVAP